MTPSHHFAVMAMALFVLCGGCGGNQTDRGPLGYVSGQVTYKGDVVTEGTVHFNNPTNGFGAVATIESDGSYKLNSADGLPIGQYNISVMPPIVMESVIPNSPPSEVPKDMPNIPKKYRYEKSSGLTVNVTEGKVTFDINMED